MPVIMIPMPAKMMDPAISIVTEETEALVPPVNGRAQLIATLVMHLFLADVAHITFHIHVPVLPVAMPLAKKLVQTAVVT